LCHAFLLDSHHSTPDYSIASVETTEDLSATMYQAGQSPFVLRLPLGGYHSSDAVEEGFGFERRRSKLMNVINVANESAHDAHGRVQEARSYG
jgi:separase